jgi:hypothetical protein
LCFQFRGLSLSLLVREFTAILDVLLHPCFFFRQRPGSYWLLLWRAGKPVRLAQPANRCGWQYVAKRSPISIGSSKSGMTVFAYSPVLPRKAELVRPQRLQVLRGLSVPILNRALSGRTGRSDANGGATDDVRRGIKTAGAVVDQMSAPDECASDLVGDFNHHGKEDEALADDGTAGVIVFLGHGNGTFAVPKEACVEWGLLIRCIRPF